MVVMGEEALGERGGEFFSPKIKKGKEMKIKIPFLVLTTFYSGSK